MSGLRDLNINVTDRNTETDTARHSERLRDLDELTIQTFISSTSRCFNSDMSITVRSAYGAEEGDNVSICYTDSLWATAARRENLVYSKVRLGSDSQM